MSLRRRTVVLAALAAGGLVLLAAGQTWVHATGLASGAVSEVTADGSDASGVISAMAFVVLAAGLALTIARSVGRWVVGVLLVLAGATLAVTALQAVLDPAAAAEPAVSAVTGTTESAGSYALTAWPWVAVVGGVLAVLAGLAALLAGRGWSHSRRFEAPAAASATGTTTTAPASATDRTSGTAGTDDRRRASAPAEAVGDRPTPSDGAPETAGEGRRRGADAVHARAESDGGSAGEADEEELDPTDAWDELSAGNDPTR